MQCCELFCLLNFALLSRVEAGVVPTYLMSR